MNKSVTAAPNLLQCGRCGAIGQRELVLQEHNCDPYIPAMRLSELRAVISEETEKAIKRWWSGDKSR